jgi:hypothetical protein
MTLTNERSSDRLTATVGTRSSPPAASGRCAWPWYTVTIRSFQFAPAFRISPRKQPLRKANGVSCITVGKSLGLYRQCSETSTLGSKDGSDRALPIRRFPVSRLRLRRARDLWVFNPNELRTKELVNGESRDRANLLLEV